MSSGYTISMTTDAEGNYISGFYGAIVYTAGSKDFTSAICTVNNITSLISLVSSAAIGGTYVYSSQFIGANSGEVASTNSGSYDTVSCRSFKYIYSSSTNRYLYFYDNYTLAFGTFKVAGKSWGMTVGLSLCTCVCTNLGCGLTFWNGGAGPIWESFCGVTSGSTNVLPKRTRNNYYNIPWRVYGFKIGL